MVPSQMSVAHVESFGDKLPFVAIKLHSIPDGRALKDIQSNRYVFIRIDGNVKGFCFNDPSKDGSAPNWHILYAGKRGKFTDGNFDFYVFRTEAGSTRLVSTKYAVTVVSQLRYEYALNLIQKFGVSITRIGLDFV